LINGLSYPKVCDRDAMGQIEYVWLEKRDLVCCACRMELYAEMVGETTSKCCCSCHINIIAGNGLQETPASLADT
jgi:hypothetical protein